MDILRSLKDVDFFTWLISLFMMLSAIVFVYELICRFCSILGKPIGAVKERKKDHDLVVQNTKDIKNLSEQHKKDVEEYIKHDRAIREDLNRLTTMFIDKQIDDMRYEILDFASSLSSGKKYNKEQFDHIIKIDNKYQKILASQNRKNGQVSVSMKYINDEYMERLKSGFSTKE